MKQKAFFILAIIFAIMNLISCQKNTNNETNNNTINEVDDIAIRYGANNYMFLGSHNKLHRGVEGFIDDNMNDWKYRYLYQIDTIMQMIYQYEGCNDYQKAAEYRMKLRDVQFELQYHLYTAVNATIICLLESYTKDSISYTEINMWDSISYFKNYNINDEESYKKALYDISYRNINKKTTMQTRTTNKNKF